MTKKGNSSKPFKPNPETVLAIQTLMKIVEDEKAWSEDEEKQLKSVHSYTHRIDQLQSTTNYVSLIPDRKQEDLDNLVTWAKEEHHFDTEKSGIKIGFTDEKKEDATFFASKNIETGSTLVNIPSSGIISSIVEHRQEDVGKLIENSGALGRSPSLLLTVILLMECYNYNNSSRFSKYVKALPKKLNTPFSSFNDDHQYYDLLKPSAYIHKASLRMLRAQLRDYCGLFSSLSVCKLPSLPTSCLSLKNYRWAISIVMTRQNALPPKSPSPKAPPVMALIPLWDMFNHDVGKSTTSVTLRDDQLSIECTAMRDFQKGEPIKMCYGVRPSGQLALYSGFILEDGTPNDEILIQVPLTYDKSDEKGGDDVINSMPQKQVIMLKARVLGKKNISVDLLKGSFACKIPVTRGDQGIDKALGVAGVAVMTKSEFSVYLKNTDIVLPSVDDVLGLEHATSAIEVVASSLSEALLPYNQPSNHEVDWQQDPAKMIDGLLKIERNILENASEHLEQVSARLELKKASLE